MIDRRAAITGLALACTVLDASRAQSARVPVVGVLVLGNPDPTTFLRELQKGLGTLGHVEGKTVRYELRNAGGDVRRLAELAAELVAMPVDVIAAFQTPAATAAKQATSDIPVVMMAGDPVGTGLVASLAKPGGNVTGMSGTNAELAGKSLELLREFVPAMRRVAVLANATDPFTATFVEQLRRAAGAMGVELNVAMIGGDGELDAAFARMASGKHDAVVVQPSLRIAKVAGLALGARLPAISPIRGFAAEGGLFAYTTRGSELYQGFVEYVDRVLKGARPADLPVRQPTMFELVINLRTARALGITIPSSILLRADEVIE